jgi:putative chitinase
MKKKRRKKKLIRSMKITEEQLKVILPNSTSANRVKYLPILNKYWDMFEVNTKDRQAAFLAQIGHESGQFRYSEEIASGKAYEGRKDLGNIQPGDGVKYKGRGLIQVTGRTNYTIFNKWLHDNKYLSTDSSIIENPEIVSTNPEIAVLSTFWYWDKHKLNELADLPK